jgi:hypothetical protein
VLASPGSHVTKMSRRSRCLLLIAAGMLAAPAEAPGQPDDPRGAGEPADPGPPEADVPPSVPVIEATPPSTVDGIPQPTAAEVAGAPRPGETAAIVVDRADSSSAAAWPVRIALAPVRGVWWVAMQPVRGALYAYDRYQLNQVFRDIFFNEEGTFGVFPVADLYSDFGLTIGVRAVHRDLFGGSENLGLRASYGGRYRQLYDAEIDTGDRFRNLIIGAEVGYEAKPHERFFGIGNADTVEPGAVTMPVDPLVDDTAVETRYREETVRALLEASVDLPGPFSTKVSTGFVWNTFGDADDPRGDVQLTSIYDPAAVVGFQEDLSYNYTELALRFDTREAGYWLAAPVPNNGWFLSVFGGYAAGFDQDPSDYVRYGADLQRFIPLWGDMRFLTLRAFTEAVTGDLDEVPFDVLPILGGDRLLRGYDYDRFRDRVVGMVSAEYGINIDRNIAGYFFVDAGRPWRSWSDLSIDDPRVGFGAGLQLHSHNSFYARAQIASSIDGGLFLSLVFDPAFDPREPLDEI